MQYNTKTNNYEVFGINMTLDTNRDLYSDNIVSMCKSCQCNCRLCLGGKLPQDAETYTKVDSISALEEILAA